MILAPPRPRVIVPRRRPAYRPRVPVGRCPVHPWRRAKPELLAANIRFTTGGQILFNAGQIVFNDECCCGGGCDPCSFCPDSPTPCAFDVTISGWTPGTCEAIQDSGGGWTLDGGGSLDGTYRLNQSALCAGAPAQCCLWEHNELPPTSITPTRYAAGVCSGTPANDSTDNLQFVLVRNNTPGFTLKIDYVFVTGGVTQRRTSLVLADLGPSSVNCNVTGAAMTDVRTCAAPPNHHCFGSGCTATITALP